jgi:hypothetical protein
MPNLSFMREMKSLAKSGAQRLIWFISYSYWPSLTKINELIKWITIASTKSRRGAVKCFTDIKLNIIGRPNSD